MHVSLLTVTWRTKELEESNDYAIVQTRQLYLELALAMARVSALAPSLRHCFRAEYWAAVEGIRGAEIGSFKSLAEHQLAEEIVSLVSTA